MKLSIHWLKAYIDPKLSTEALIERLTMAGLEIEAVENVAGDTVLEIEITPNRPDCLNVLGLAREIGAITGKKVGFPKISAVKAAVFQNSVTVENKKDCSRYIATLIKDVQIKEAPPEIRKCLTSVGIKTINNAVDITNFVLMETGQPLHAFDYDKLAGGKIIVRRAKAGETLVTLDGIERKLDTGILVIADAQKPVAIAGIMGGLGTEITAATKNILLESAHFDMGLIRRASRTLGLRTDSSYRFERHVNVEGVLTGANRAVNLILEYCGGKVAGRLATAVPTKAGQTKIKVRAKDIEEVLGFKVSVSQAKGWLLQLGFNVTATKDVLTVLPPSHRGDVHQTVDVIEEIARMTGFDRLPMGMPLIKASNITVDPRPRQIKAKVRQVLTAGSMDEAITLSMISAKALSKCNMSELPKMRVFNPLSLDQEFMRPSMLPSLLQVVVTNLNRGQKDLRFFEIGKRYFVDGEKETLGMVFTGRRSLDWRASKKDIVDLFDIKGILYNLFAKLGIDPIYGPNEYKVLDDSCAASLKLKGLYLGSFGKIEKKILHNWDIKNQDVYYAGIHLDEIYPLSIPRIQYHPVAEFPAITRDVSLSVKKEIPYQDIETICFKQGGEMLKSVQFIEQYLGDKIQPGFKGLVFSCQYQSQERTLREDEVNDVHQRILDALTRDLGATRR